MIFTTHFVNEYNTTTLSFGGLVHKLCNVTKWERTFITQCLFSHYISGQFTYLSSAGASVIDYIIVSTYIYESSFEFNVQNLDFFVHFPPYASFEGLSAGKIKTEHLNQAKQLAKPIWFR